MRFLSGMTKRKDKGKSGFTLLEMVMALGISSIALSSLFTMSNMVMEKTQARLISSQALAVASAARGFVENNRATVLAGLPAIDDAAEMLVSDMQDMGYMPSDFINQNAYGQTYKILVKREDAGVAGPDAADMLVILVVTTGGQTITDKMGSTLVGAMGAAGGFIFSDIPTTARGAAGGWQVDLAGAGWADIAGYTPAAGTLALLANILPTGVGGAAAVDSILLAEDAACNAENKSKLKWSDSATTLLVCDGTNWKELMVYYDPGEGEPSTPDPNGGYFVVTAGTWDGGLGGSAGANAKCLADLTANDWMGKSDATTRGLLTSTKVRAFICNKNALCQMGVGNTTYYFAVSGDVTKGGASFTTDADGIGPNNSQDWSGTNYLGGMQEYWTGQASTQSSQTAWGTIGTTDSQSPCTWSHGTNWTGIAGLDVAPTGISTATDSKRWRNVIAGCSNARKLLCFVHP